MRYSIAISLALAICLPTSAQTTQKNSKQDVCKYVSEFAELAMVGRQNGKAMPLVLDTLKDLMPGMKQVDDLIDGYVIDAYESPRYMTQEMRDRAISDFKNDKFLECFKLSLPQ